MKNLQEFFTENDHFAKKCGIVLIEAGLGKAKVKMDIKPFHFNGARTVHGGAIFTLADFAFAVASNSHGKVALAINTTMSFINPAKEGTLYAEAKELSVTRKLSNYEVMITSDKEELIAVFQGTAYRKNSPVVGEGD